MCTKQVMEITQVLPCVLKTQYFASHALLSLMSGDRGVFLGNARTTALGFALSALFRLFIASMLSHNYKYSYKNII